MPGRPGACVRVSQVSDYVPSKPIQVNFGGIATSISIPYWEQVIRRSSPFSYENHYRKRLRSQYILQVERFKFDVSSLADACH